MTIVPDVHARVWPFAVGQAVYFAPMGGAYCRPVQVFPAVVTRVNGEHITIWRDDGLRRTVGVSNLVYQGYCQACRVPAVRGDGLVCPRCEQPALAEPPPDDLSSLWFPDRHDHWSCLVRESVVSGCTRREAHDTVRERSHAAWQAMLEQTGLLESWRRSGRAWSHSEGYAQNCRLDHMEKLARIGDAEGFIALYRQNGGRMPGESSDLATIEALLDLLLDRAGDGPGRVSQRLQLAPLTLERPAADSAPDGADEVTRWLDQQFRKAA